MHCCYQIQYIQINHFLLIPSHFLFDKWNPIIQSIILEHEILSSTLSSYYPQYLSTSSELGSKRWRQLQIRSNTSSSFWRHASESIRHRSCQQSKSYYELYYTYLQDPLRDWKIQVAVNFVMRVDSSISDLIVCRRTIHKLVIGLAVVGLNSLEADLLW